jgi:hypothetical protein
MQSPLDVRGLCFCWRMRHTPGGQASLLSKLRHFMPDTPVDVSLRKSLDLAEPLIRRTAGKRRKIPMQRHGMVLVLSLRLFLGTDVLGTPDISAPGFAFAAKRLGASVCLDVAGQHADSIVLSHMHIFANEFPAIARQSRQVLSIKIPTLVLASLHFGASKMVMFLWICYAKVDVALQQIYGLSLYRSPRWHKRGKRWASRLSGQWVRMR